MEEQLDWGSNNWYQSSFDLVAESSREGRSSSGGIRREEELLLSLEGKFSNLCSKFDLLCEEFEKWRSRRGVPLDPQSLASLHSQSPPAMEPSPPPPPPAPDPYGYPSPEPYGYSPSFSDPYDCYQSSPSMWDQPHLQFSPLVPQNQLPPMQHQYLSSSEQWLSVTSQITPQSQQQYPCSDRDMFDEMSVRNEVQGGRKTKSEILVFDKMPVTMVIDQHRSPHYIASQIHVQSSMPTSVEFGMLPNDIGISSPMVRSVPSLGYTHHQYTLENASFGTTTAHQQASYTHVGFSAYTPSLTVSMGNTNHAHFGSSLQQWGSNPHLNVQSTPGFQQQVTPELPQIGVAAQRPVAYAQMGDSGPASEDETNVVMSDNNHSLGGDDSFQHFYKHTTELEYGGSIVSSAYTGYNMSFSQDIEVLGLSVNVPDHMDLHDAYKLATGNKSNLPSPNVSKVITKKDSFQAYEDLKLPLKINDEVPFQISAGDVSYFICTRLQGEVSSSAVLRNITKLLAIERNESGLKSLDRSTVSEIEGESVDDRLKQQIELDIKSLYLLYKMLEEERSASEVAPNQAIAMITRQVEKVALQMFLKYLLYAWYLRIADYVTQVASNFNNPPTDRSYMCNSYLELLEIQTLPNLQSLLLSSFPSYQHSSRKGLWTPTLMPASQDGPAEFLFDKENSEQMMVWDPGVAIYIGGSSCNMFSREGLQLAWDPGILMPTMFSFLFVVYQNCSSLIRQAKDLEVPEEGRSFSRVVHCL